MRSDRDSNSGSAFDAYTLSRRTSSATRASLHGFADTKVDIIFEMAKFLMIFRDIFLRGGG